MSKYTTEVRYICEVVAGYRESQDYKKIDEILEFAHSRIFNFNYPIFDESYRSVLEIKILKHFYTREIGCETVGLWKHYLNMKLNEIMPYYNKLYLSELIEFNPLYNVRYDTTYEGSASGNSTDNDNGSLSEGIDDNTRSSWDSMDKFSDTPQGSVRNLENGTYLTSARQVTGGDDTDYTRDRDVTTRNTRNGQFSNTDQYLKHVEGSNGSRSLSELLMQYRETFLNIDMMIINELNDLFMGVW